jgi:anti-anti-sigma factor
VPNGGHSLDVRRVDDVTVVALSGELDIAAADDLDVVFREVPDEQRAVLDLSEVDFMDSSGLAVVLRESMRRRDAGASLQLRRPSATVRRLIEFCCLDHLLETEEHSSHE